MADVSTGSDQECNLIVDVLCKRQFVGWPIQRPQPSLFLPSSTVASTLERTFVVRVSNGVTEWVDVKTGATSGKLTEVFGDLHEGDVVLSRGTDEIQPGNHVVVRIASPAPQRQ